MKIGSDFAFESDRRVEAPVLIVGAGPVGLAMANELGWRGVSCMVVDKATEQIDFPTCESVNTRTMEHFRRWGLADKVRFAGFPPDLPRSVRFVTRALGHELVWLNRPSNREQQTLLADISPEGTIWCPKYLFDPVLRQQLHAYPHVTLAMGWEMQGFTAAADRVSVALRQVETGATGTVECRYLAACDGAASGIRKSLGIEMAGSFAEGQNFSIYFRSTALRDALADRPGVMMDIINPDLRANLSSVDGDARWRLIQFIGPGAADAIDPAACVRQAIGRAVPFELIRALSWAGHRVVANRFGHGRVFLVGDAAHLLWPRGGFGMNTGVGDAVDLAWKLEAMLAGWGGAGLLASYQIERRPVAVRNVDEAASNRAEDAALPLSPAIEDDTPAGTAARQALAAIILERRTKEWNSFGIQLGYVYDPSPICCADGTPPGEAGPSDYVPTTRPGARAPHFWLSPGHSILDLFGHGFRLLCFAAGDIAPFRQAARRRGLPLSAMTIDGPAAAALYERNFVLVRPDGHVAWRGDSLPADPLAVIDRVRGAGPDIAPPHRPAVALQAG